MYFYHNYEFKRTRCSFIWTLVLVSVVVGETIYFVSYLISFHESGQDAMAVYLTIEYGCTYPTYGALLLRLYYMVYFIFCQPTLLLVFLTIKVKKTSDILQGLSKLDYLLKVSRFQKYKDKQLEANKFSMYSGNDSP